MALTAATATPDPIPYAQFAGFLLLVTLGYLGWCAVDPFTRCRRCAGLGRFRKGRGVVPCLRCDAHGIKLRVGRRFINHLIHLHRAAGTARRATARLRDDAARDRGGK